MIAFIGDQEAARLCAGRRRMAMPGEPGEHYWKFMSKSPAKALRTVCDLIKTCPDKVTVGGQDQR